MGKIYFKVIIAQYFTHQNIQKAIQQDRSKFHVHYPTLKKLSSDNLGSNPSSRNFPAFNHRNKVNVYCTGLM